MVYLECMVYVLRAPSRKLSQGRPYTKVKVLIDYPPGWERFKTLTFVYHLLLAIVLYDVSHA